LRLLGFPTIKHIAAQRKMFAAVFARSLAGRSAVEEKF